MIGWGWLIAAFFLGDMMGIIVMAILYGSWSHKEEREKEAANRLFSELPADQGDAVRALWEEFDAMETADAKYAACLDRLQPFLHNTLTEGHTWVLGGTDRASVEKRMSPIKDFMPEVYKWIDKSIDIALEKGWLKP